MMKTQFVAGVACTDLHQAMARIDGAALARLEQAIADANQQVASLAVGEARAAQPPRRVLLTGASGGIGGGVRDCGHSAGPDGRDPARHRRAVAQRSRCGAAGADGSAPRAERKFCPRVAHHRVRHRKRRLSPGLNANGAGHRSTSRRQTRLTEIDKQAGTAGNTKGERLKCQTARQIWASVFCAESQLKCSSPSPRPMARAGS